MLVLLLITIMIQLLRWEKLLRILVMANSKQDSNALLSRGDCETKHIAQNAVRKSGTRLNILRDAFMKLAVGAQQRRTTFSFCAGLLWRIKTNVALAIRV